MPGINLYLVRDTLRKAYLGTLREVESILIKISIGRISVVNEGVASFYTMLFLRTILLDSKVVTSDCIRLFKT